MATWRAILMLKEMMFKVSKVFRINLEEKKETKVKGKRSKEQEVFISPITGKIVPLENVPDQVFSKGVGFAIQPLEGTVVSPVDGKVINLFPTRHAITIKSQEGLEILIHVGIDTANLKGEGFEAFVKQGDQVKKGQKLLEVHLNYVERFVPSTITSIIFSNLQEGKQIQLVKEGPVKRGDLDIIHIL